MTDTQIPTVEQADTIPRFRHVITALARTAIHFQVKDEAQKEENINDPRTQAILAITSKWYESLPNTVTDYIEDFAKRAAGPSQKWLPEKMTEMLINEEGEEACCVEGHQKDTVEILSEFHKQEDFITNKRNLVVQTVHETLLKNGKVSLNIELLGAEFTNTLIGVMESRGFEKQDEIEGIITMGISKKYAGLWEEGAVG